MKKCVVLIDDDEVFLEAMTRELKDLVNVVGFLSPNDAIGYLKENGKSVDVVCVDLQMQDVQNVFWQLGGLNVMQSIRSELGDDTPLLYALTGMDAMVHIHTCLKNGADGFLEKGQDLRNAALRLVDSADLANVA